MFDDTPEPAEPGSRITFWQLPLFARVLLLIGLACVFGLIVKALTPRPTVSGRMPEPINTSDVDEPILIVVSRSDFTRAVHDVAERHTERNGRGPARTRGPRREETPAP